MADLSKKNTGKKQTSTPRTAKQQQPRRSSSARETQTVTSADVATVSADELLGGKVVDTNEAPLVNSTATANMTSDAASLNNVGDVAPALEDKKVMAAITLTVDPKQRKSTSVVFNFPKGVRGSARFSKTAFPNGIPESLTLQSEKENAFAEPKAKLTAEQRKELRKNAPKLTPAQKLIALQERAAKLAKKIAEQSAAASAPVAEPVAQ